ncbi:6-phospho-beta-glucosidase [Nocardioides rotundus]|uniref:family 4 glycosyl hydrolase n=1 Tax=Nocardioides rotundus TaxID=1774216 RepID=UPI001CC01CD9|nr:6-phospho-beta-glucosidase [Nocardioides rotundus]UAL30167.1 6-phospho-beta-glucosidase [Nocardioides rotundus]
MQLTILGGGGFRVPLVFRALVEDPALGVDRLVLHDTDPARLAAVEQVLRHLSYGASAAPSVHLTTDLAEAVTGADFVFSAIRVGGLDGRTCDELVPRAEGVIGQETTGAGGVLYGLRTVPVARRIAEVVAERASTAHLINFTNPAGLVTEAMRPVLGDRVVGICDSPVGLMRRVARALEVPPEEAEFAYAGLNHLGWLREVRVDGVDRLPDLLGDPELLLRIEEGRLFGPDWLATIGAVPNEYLWYWYYRSDALAAEERGPSRGELLVEQQRDFWAAAPGLDPADAFARWEETRVARESTYMADSRAATEERDPYDLDGGGYDRVALAVMRAVATDAPQRLVLNVPNRGTLPFLDDAAVIEVPCEIDGSGARPLPAPVLDAAQQGMVTSVKAVDRLVLRATHEGSRETAVEALALHPLVGSVPVARRILAAELERVPSLAEALPHGHL